MRNTGRICVGKSEEKSFARPKCRGQYKNGSWEKQCEGVHWIQLIHDIIQ